MKKFIFPCILLASFSIFGQAELSPYMQLYLDGATEVTETHKKVSGSQTGNNRIVSVFLYLKDGYDIAILKDAGAEIGTIAGGVATARIPLERLDDVSALDCVSYIEKASPAYSRLDEAKTDAGISRIHAGEGLPTPFRGNGVIIGIIDNGFEYGHPNFYDTDKKHLRIKRVWDQNKSGASPENFSYGAEYRTEQEILSAAYDSDASYHGTHVLGIAAGADNTDGHNYAGVAGDADIVLVSLNSEEMVYGDNTTVIDGIKYIYDYAESVGKPCVINLSLGSHIGPHDGTSAFDRMADALQGPGKLLVGSVGNEGQHKFHLEASFENSTNSETQRIGTFVDFKYVYSEYSMVEMWGDKGMTYEFIPFIYNIKGEKVDKTYEPITIGNDRQNTGEYAFTLAEDNLAGSIRIISEINPDNGKGHAMAVFNFFKSDDYRIGFYIASKQKGSVHMWTDDYYSGLSNFECPNFSDGDYNCSMGELGGTGKRIISVGAHVTRDHYTRFGIYYPSGEETGHIASFSSRGPTADGRVKPDISAPGSYIVSSMSSVYTGQVAKAVSITWNGTKYPFGFMQGSSMAAPLVAGSLACWLQAKPDLTPEEASEIIRKTAINDKYTGELSAEGNNTWGHGKIDAWAGLKETIRLSGISSPMKETSQMTLWHSGRTISVISVTDRKEARMSLYSLSGMEILNEKLTGIKSGVEYTVDASILPPGLYIAKLICGNDTIIKKITVRK